MVHMQWQGDKLHTEQILKLSILLKLPLLDRQFDLFFAYDCNKFQNDA